MTPDCRPGPRAVQDPLTLGTFAERQLSDPRGDIDAVAHEVAVALLDHIAHMDSDPELNPPIRW
jgi:hypothetical protein